MTNTFMTQMNQRLSSFDQSVLNYSTSSYLSIKENFDYIEHYIITHQLENAYIALHLVRGLLSGKRETKPVEYFHDGYARGIYLNHCLYVTRVLIDLEAPLELKEIDHMLAASLAHVLVEKVNFNHNGQELVADYGLDQEVLDLILTNKRKKDLSSYYNQIQQNKLALLIKLADRGNIIEQLYASNVDQIEKYIKETKQYFLPMCIYGKEHYPSLFHAINLQSSKIKYLVDVTEILTNKHIKIMTALNDEIINLKESNANLKRLITRLESK